jgi:hypothetical protein
MREIRVAHDKTLVLLYAKNLFTERTVCKSRMVGEENSTRVVKDEECATTGISKL